MDKAAFQKRIRDFYTNNGRQLPWRTASLKLRSMNTEPSSTDENQPSRMAENQYKVFISEIMLQQTQTSRVIPKYEKWIEQFLDFPSLAAADRSQVLDCWQGLGYNRRAVYVHKSARKVVDGYDGTLPDQEAALRELPGVGAYTAGALQAFCFGKPAVFTETNIRTVFIHHFFSEENNISDTAIKGKIQETLPAEKIREWYWGLMDYGHYLKQEVGNPNSRSDSYQTQSSFKGSNRQLRSQLLRFILENQPVDKARITKQISQNTDRQKSLEANLINLVKEGMITEKDGMYTAAE